MIYILLLRQFSNTMNKDNVFENKLQRNNSVVYGHIVFDYLWWKERKFLLTFIYTNKL